MTSSLATAALVVGYVLAVPFTLWIPGYRRMWRRRELWVFVVAEVGAALIALGWALKGNVPSTVVNVVWLLGFGAAWLLAPRYQPRSSGRGARS